MVLVLVLLLVIFCWIMQTSWKISSHPTRELPHSRNVFPFYSYLPSSHIPKYFKILSVTQRCKDKSLESVSCFEQKLAYEFSRYLKLLGSHGDRKLHWSLESSISEIERAEISYLCIKSERADCLKAVGNNWSWEDLPPIKGIPTVLSAARHLGKTSHNLYLSK